MDSRDIRRIIGNLNSALFDIRAAVRAGDAPTVSALFERTRPITANEQAAATVFRVFCAMASDKNAQNEQANLRALSTALARIGMTGVMLYGAPRYVQSAIAQRGASVRVSDKYEIAISLIGSAAGGANDAGDESNDTASVDAPRRDYSRAARGRGNSRGGSRGRGGRRDNNRAPPAQSHDDMVARMLARVDAAKVPDHDDDHTEYSDHDDTDTNTNTNTAAAPSPVVAETTTEPAAEPSAEPAAAKSTDAETADAAPEPTPKKKANAKVKATPKKKATAKKAAKKDDEVKEAANGDKKIDADTPWADYPADNDN